MITAREVSHDDREKFENLGNERNFNDRQEEHQVSEEEGLNEEGIKKSSPFHKYFTDITESTIEAATEEEPDQPSKSANPHYAPKLIYYFQNNYLPLLPFFTIAIDKNINQLKPNSQVEKIFFFYKYTVLKDLPLTCEARRPSVFFSKIRKMNNCRTNYRIIQEKKEKRKHEEADEDKWDQSTKKRKGTPVKPARENKLLRKRLNFTPKSSKKKNPPKTTNPPKTPKKKAKAKSGKEPIEKISAFKIFDHFK